MEVGEDAFGGESSPVKQLPQNTMISTKSGLYDSTSREASNSTVGADKNSNTSTLLTLDSPFVYGTWWEYPKEPSGKKLILDIPKSNPWLGHISSNCQEVLQGLLELRPTHRWGGRHIVKLNNHPWLEEKNLSNWVNLAKKDPEVTPHFIPGKPG